MAPARRRPTTIREPGAGGCWLLFAADARNAVARRRASTAGALSHFNEMTLVATRAIAATMASSVRRWGVMLSCSQMLGEHCVVVAARLFLCRLMRLRGVKTAANVLLRPRVFDCSTKPSKTWSRRHRRMRVSILRGRCKRSVRRFGCCERGWIRVWNADVNWGKLTQGASGGKSARACPTRGRSSVRALLFLDSNSMQPLASEPPERRR